MKQKVFLVTPPFTQLNTPYPATAYIKGFLNLHQIESCQADLGIDVVNQLFSENGMTYLFDVVGQNELELNPNTTRIYTLREEYIATIEPVIAFLQHKDPTLAHSICDRSLLPEASRFTQADDLEWAFGSMGFQDKARHLATLYLEDIADFIRDTVDPHFGFTRYAEKLGESATNFDELYEELKAPNTFIDEISLQLLEAYIEQHQPTAIGFSVPFPGNLYGALKCGQFIKEKYPEVKVFMGGGYPNTELRSLREPRVFEFVDFITLDDGERPLFNLMEFLRGERTDLELKRTFALKDGEVTYLNGAKERDFPFAVTGTPDYEGLLLETYLSVIEVANPMHALWSDGRWNKMTLAHGCYWGKCSFCDISLDYIKNYEPVTPVTLCDRMETLIAQTGETGFHFVDEAAPPALMRDLAIEILKRGLKVTWWTNIRFESSFSSDLCFLLKASGCIAVSGGLEVASDRLLEKMKKGVTIEQVAQVTHNFSSAGIMVHAYLMYGFPTQTEQETIDSLEVVRQLFMQGLVHSAFWHQFAMTSHSPVGLAPEDFGVKKTGPRKGLFADNGLQHEDPEGAEHALFSEGLKRSLFNYMHGLCFDYDLQEWFDFSVPRTTHPEDLIYRAVEEYKLKAKSNAKLVWLGTMPQAEEIEKKKRGKVMPFLALYFYTKKEEFTIHLKQEQGEWFLSVLEKIVEGNTLSLKILSEEYEREGLGDFQQFMNQVAWQTLRKNGLLLV